MTFAIHASKNGQSVVTVRISPDATADKARLLESFGWQVHITDLAGRQFGVSDLSSRDCVPGDHRRRMSVIGKIQLS